MAGQAGEEPVKDYIFLRAESQYTTGITTMDFPFKHLTSVLRAELTFEDDDVTVDFTGSVDAASRSVAATDDVTGIQLAGEWLKSQATVNVATKAETSTEGAIDVSGTFNPGDYVYIHFIPGTVPLLTLYAKVGSDEYMSKLEVTSNPLEAGKMYYKTATFKRYKSVDATTLGSMTDDDLDKIKYLKVTGDLTTAAYAKIQSWGTTAREYLDLSEASIVAGETYNYTDPGNNAHNNVSITANEVPTFLFNSTKITTVILPNSATVLSANAFYTTTIKELVIGEDMATINCSFTGCTITSITSKNPTAPTKGTSAFSNMTTGSITVYVPNGSTSSYQSTWGTALGSGSQIRITYIEQQ